MNNFTLSLTVSSFLGSDLREYTTLPRVVDPIGPPTPTYALSGSALSVGLGARVAF